MSESEEVTYTECSDISVSGGWLTFNGTKQGQETPKSWAVNLTFVRNYSINGSTITVDYIDIEQGEQNEPN